MTVSYINSYITGRGRGNPAVSTIPVPVLSPGYPGTDWVLCAAGYAESSLLQSGASTLSPSLEKSSETHAPINCMPHPPQLGEGGDRVVSQYALPSGSQSSRSHPGPWEIVLVQPPIYTKIVHFRYLYFVC